MPRFPAADGQFHKRLSNGELSGDPQVHRVIHGLLPIGDNQGNEIGSSGSVRERSGSNRQRRCRTKRDTESEVDILGTREGVGESADGDIRK